MEDETTTVDDPRADAAFGAGFGGKDSAATNSEPSPSTGAKDDPAPEYVQITKAEWEKATAAAEKTAAYEKQFSTVFGTIGKTKQTLEQAINDLRAKVEGQKSELSTAAYTKLKDQFPELAEMTKEMVEARLAALKQPEASKANVEEELQALNDAYPDWREIVGAVEVGQQPDPNNPFRKWLSTQPQDYQDRINNAMSSAPIERSIARFRRETRQQTRQTPRPQPSATRREVLAAAVQPKGDGAPPTQRNTVEDAFTAGFQS